jgi:hypothetical protein
VQVGSIPTEQSIERAQARLSELERLIPHQGDRQAVRHGMAIDGLAVDFQRAGAGLAKAWAVILPVELKRMLTRRERLLALPRVPAARSQPDDVRVAPLCSRPVVVP